MTIPKRTSVLIVGGGPVGLTAAGLLSLYGTPCLVVERRKEMLRPPAAHVIRTRPLEVLAQLGIEDQIHAATPHLPMHYITWCATLGGPEVGRLDLRGAAGSGEAGDSAWINLSQNKLEPILAAGVSRQASARIEYGAECLEIIENGNGLTARIRCDDGSEHDVQANWAIAADGAGSPTRKALDIEMIGDGPLGRFHMMHIKADLTPWIEDRPSPIYWIMNPESPGTLIVHDPQRSHVFMSPVLGLENEAQTLANRLKAALAVPAEVEIVATDAWAPYCQVAARFRKGRVFLVGDSAHRFPPSGGLGLNTGIMEAHNIAWKIAMFEAGKAGESILDTYESECRSAAETNARESFANALRLALISTAIGEVTDLPCLEERLRTMTDSERGELSAAIEAQRSHFMSDGAFPEPAADGDPASPMRIPAPYGGFTVFSADDEPWRKLARAASRALDVEIGFQRLPQAELERLPMPSRGFLTRPDGIVLWAAQAGTSEPEAGLVASVRAALHLPDNAPSQTLS